MWANKAPKQQTKSSCVFPEFWWLGNNHRLAILNWLKGRRNIDAMHPELYRVHGPLRERPLSQRQLELTGYLFTSPSLFSIESDQC